MEIDRVCTGAVLRTAKQAFGFTRLSKRDVVHFMPLMQAAQHFERSNLTATGRGMQEIRLHPKNLQALIVAFATRSASGGASRTTPADVLASLPFT